LAAAVPLRTAALLSGPAASLAAAPAPGETVVTSEPWPAAAAIDTQPVADLTGLTLFDSARGVADGPVESVAWPAAPSLGLEAVCTVHGTFTVPRKLRLFLAINAPGADGKSGAVLFKRIEERDLAPGIHRFLIADALALAQLGGFGPQTLRVHAEAQLRGADQVSRRDLTLRYDGPPPPAATVGAVGLRDAAGAARDIFTPGAQFTVDARLAAQSNQLGPLRAVVRTELDCAECAAGHVQLPEVPAAAEYRELPGSLGQWVLTAQGRLPEGLPERDSGFIPFRVTVLLLSGDSVVAEASRFAVIRTSGAARPGARGIELAPAADWTLGPG
jgi:hypothetical protein